MAADDPREVALQAERAVNAEIFTTDRGGTGAEAVLAAAAASREGRRAAVVLGKGELVGALDALRAAARARAPIVVHVLCGAGGTGHDEIALALEVGAGVLVAWSAQDVIDL